MIQKISIKNYKSIQSLPDFELKPVNILIGANNSGKSNFLDVFAFLRVVHGLWAILSGRNAPPECHSARNLPRIGTVLMQGKMLTA
jgi:predicted ATPase